MRVKRTDQGTVTAESVVVLPVLVLVAVSLIWLVSLGVVQIRAVDAARETARVVARGESTQAGISVGSRVAAPGSTISVSLGEQQVVVRVVSRVRGPGRLLAALGSVELTAQAIAAREPGP